MGHELTEWVAVAHLLKTRGNRGELLAELLTSRWERLQELRRVTLRWESGREQAVELADVWQYRGLVVLKFAGIDSITDAEALEGADVCISRAERTELPEGEYYFSDLVGCRVIERGSQRELGEVTGWVEYGGQALLEVRTRDGEALVPFVRDICVEISPLERRIVVEAPEGLLETQQ